MTKELSSEEKRFLQLLENELKEGRLPEKYFTIISSFYQCYSKAIGDPKLYVPIFENFFELFKVQFQHPYQFEPYHERIRKPFDYYQFGIDFMKPLIDIENSDLQGYQNLRDITTSLEAKENAIFLANHQTETDPQMISILLEGSFEKLAEEMIFVAGERVLTDPLAIPFSMGRNLLCIYSKKYIDNPPEKKHEKQLHNKRTMYLMSKLLSEGGKSIYVAPSGGRDRRNAEGVVEVAPFDPQSLEMFHLMAKKAKRPTYFYPLALATYDILPPPDSIQKELGEARSATRCSIHMSFGSKISMEDFPGCQVKDKIKKRTRRAEFIWTLVNQAYQRITS